MRHRTLSVAIAALTWPLLAGGLSGDDQPDPSHRREPRVFRATLAGLNEVPPVSTTARGTFRLEINDDETAMDFRLTYTVLEGAPAGVAHVHFGPTTANGGVMFFMCGGPANPPTNPCPPSGTVTGTITAADVVGPAGQGIAAGEFAEVIAAIRSGNSYANVHNPPVNPAGHIRGQLRASH